MSPTEKDEQSSPRPKGARLHKIAYGIGVAFLVAVIWKIGPANALRTIIECDWRYAAAAAVVYGVGQLWRGGKWFYWLRFAQPGIRPWPVVGCYVTNAFVSNLTPARAGEAFTPLLLEERCGTKKSTGLAMLIVDRLLDLSALCSLLLAAGVVVFFKGEQHRNLIQGLWFGAGVMVAGLVSMAVLWRVSKTWSGGESQGLVGRLRGALAKTHAAFDQLASPGRLSIGMVLTFGAWGIDLISQWLMINAVVSITLVDNAICQVVAAAAALISLVPGGLGVTTASQAVVAGRLGYPWQAVAAGSLLNVIVNHSLRWTLATVASRSSAALDQGQAE